MDNFANNQNDIASHSGLPFSLDLIGKVAIVTGAQRGALVMASDRSPAIEELRQHGVETFVGDVVEEATAIRTAQRSVEKFGTVDILVTNAGRTLNGDILDTSVDAFDDIMAVNASGNFLHICEAVRVMRVNGQGTIVSVASVSSTVAFATQTAYAGSKGAIAQKAAATRRLITLALQDNQTRQNGPNPLPRGCCSLSPPPCLATMCF